MTKPSTPRDRRGQWANKPGGGESGAAGAGFSSADGTDEADTFPASGSTNDQVEWALRNDATLTVDTDIGKIDLRGDELRSEWDLTGPGEGFVVTDRALPAALTDQEHAEAVTGVEAEFSGMALAAAEDDDNFDMARADQYQLDEPSREFVTAEFNDFASTHPELIREMRKEYTPHEIGREFAHHAHGGGFGSERLSPEVRERVQRAVERREVLDGGSTDYYAPDDREVVSIGSTDYQREKQKLAEERVEDILLLHRGNEKQKYDELFSQPHQRRHLSYATQRKMSEYS